MSSVLPSSMTMTSNGLPISGMPPRHARAEVRRVSCSLYAGITSDKYGSSAMRRYLTGRPAEFRASAPANCSICFNLSVQSPIEPLRASAGE